VSKTGDDSIFATGHDVDQLKVMFHEEIMLRYLAIQLHFIIMWRITKISRLQLVYSINFDNRTFS